MICNDLIKSPHNKIKKVNIVFGIGTDSGKTHITSKFIKSINLKFKNFFAIKPIISGFDVMHYQLSDNFRLLVALGIKNPTLEEVLLLSKYTLHQPISPDIASWRENVNISFDDIIAFCEQRIDELPHERGIFIETAGGVCTPCSDKKSMIDISRSLAKYEPCNILVVNEYLGAISHTISALHMLKFDVIILNRVSKDFTSSIKNHLPYEITMANEEDI